MKIKLSIVLSFLACMTIFLAVHAQTRTESKHEMLKSLPKEFKDKMQIDSEYINAAKEPAKIKELENRLISDNAEYILNAKELDFEICDQFNKSAYLFYSKRLGDVVNIVIAVNCGKKYYLHIEYFIFKDADKAKMGANEKLQGIAAPIYEDQVNKTLTGRKKGDFCVISQNNGTRGAILFFLYDNAFVYLDISSVEPIKPELVDQWADAILNKIKKGRGEKVEPIKIP